MRNFEMNKLLVLTLGVFVTACSERPTEPGALSSPAFAKGGAAACPTPADVVVSDEGSLLAALSAAEPGDVIGIDGLIAITLDILIDTEELTLTCATSGSGLVAQPGVDNMIQVGVKGVRVERLILDAGASSESPYFALNDGATAFAEEVRLSNNIITCGPQQCAFLRGVAGARIEGNRFESGGSGTGVHIQGQGPRAPDGSQPRPIDGTRVRDNTIIATAPSSVRAFGGIRIRDGANLVVKNNNVLGPWANSIAVANVSESDFDGNRLEGAVNVGIAASTGGANPPISARDNRFRNNTIVGAGLAAIFARRGACRNLFQGNELQFNPLVIFDVTTGANTLKGTANAVVIDDGNFDCDGDGVADPNIILGIGGSGYSGSTAAASVLSPQLLRGLSLSDTVGGPGGEAKAVVLQ